MSCPYYIDKIKWLIHFSYFFTSCMNCIRFILKIWRLLYFPLGVQWLNTCPKSSEKSLKDQIWKSSIHICHYSIKGSGYIHHKMTSSQQLSLATAIWSTLQVLQLSRNSVQRTWLGKLVITKSIPSHDWSQNNPELLQETMIVFYKEKFIRFYMAHSSEERVSCTLQRFIEHRAKTKQKQNISLNCVAIFSKREGIVL